ncbi:MAG: GNAT family N-acetyltransferase [Gemmatimonadales bacterium]
MATPTEARVLTEAEYPAWSALAATSPDGSPYSLPDYLDALCGAAGGSFAVLGAFRADVLVGGVALYLRHGTGGRWAGPRLLLYYQSPVLQRAESKYPSVRTSRDLETLGALGDAISALGLDAATLKFRHTIADVRPFLERGWSVRPSYSYVVPLDNLAAQRGLVEQNLRRLVDRCERDGLTVAEDDDFASFHALHVRTLDRKDAHPYLPPGPFRRYWEGIRRAGLGRLYHARLADGRAIASQLVVAGRHPLAHTVSAASDPDFLRMGANAFLRWKAFEALHAAGYAANDLTDAALNPVTHFKAQFGGELVLCHVADQPSSRRWRAARARERMVARLRSAARRLAGGGGEGAR